eukprot:tig00000079_g2795.t1
MDVETDETPRGPIPKKPVGQTHERILAEISARCKRYAERAKLNRQKCALISRAVEAEGLKLLGVLAQAPASELERLADCADALIEISRNAEEALKQYGSRFFTARAIVLGRDIDLFSRLELGLQAAAASGAESRGYRRRAPAARCVEDGEDQAALAAALERAAANTQEDQVDALEAVARDAPRCAQAVCAIRRELSGPGPLLPAYRAALEKLLHKLLARRRGGAGAEEEAGHSWPPVFAEGAARPLYVIRRSELLLGPLRAKGAYGKVYEAAWLGSPVAAKSIDVFGDGPGALRDFHREAMVHARLSHPNVVQFLGACAGDSDSSLYLCMEYCARGSLNNFSRQRARDGAPLSLPERVDIAIGVAKGMVHLTQLVPPVTHSDLKPANVLIADDGSPRVADFGLARWKKDTMSRTLGVGGTVQYSAPEARPRPRPRPPPLQLTPPQVWEENHSGTEEADVYSFGVLLWELVTGRAPWERRSTPQIHKLVCVDQARPEIPPDTPEPLAALIARCWSHQPHARPRFRAVLAALERFRASGPAPAPSRPPLPSSSPPPAPAVAEHAPPARPPLTPSTTAPAPSPAPRNPAPPRPAASTAPAGGPSVWDRARRASSGPSPRSLAGRSGRGASGPHPPAPPAPAPAAPEFKVTPGSARTDASTLFVPRPTTAASPSVSPAVSPRPVLPLGDPRPAYSLSTSRTLLVKAGGGWWAAEKNTYRSLCKALADAAHGDRIHLHPGLYEERCTVRVAKAVHVEGIGPRDSCVLQRATGGPGKFVVSLESPAGPDGCPPPPSRTCASSRRRGWAAEGAEGALLCGVWAEGAGTAVEVEAGTVRTCETGLFASEGARLRVRGARVSDCGEYGLRVAADAGPCAAEACIVHDCRLGPALGIPLGAPS